MPNHYTTILLCQRGNPDTFDVDLWNEMHNDSNLCEIVRPRPEELAGVTKGSHPILGDVFRVNDHGAYESAPPDLADKYGFDNEIDWAMANWGTKWGAYEPRAFSCGGDSDPVIVTFQSAWGPPNGSCMRLILDWLKKRYGLGDVLVIGSDPKTMTFKAFG